MEIGFQDCKIFPRQFLFFFNRGFTQQQIIFVVSTFKENDRRNWLDAVFFRPVLSFLYATFERIFFYKFDPEHFNVLSSNFQKKMYLSSFFVKLWDSKIADSANFA